MTDSQVAAAYCDSYSRPPGNGSQKIAMVRLATIVRQLRADLEKLGVEPTVQLIAGKTNTRADTLSRVPDSGNHSKIVFGLTEHATAQQYSKSSKMRPKTSKKYDIAE